MAYRDPLWRDLLAVFRRIDGWARDPKTIDDKETRNGD